MELLLKARFSIAKFFYNGDQTLQGWNGKTNLDSKAGWFAIAEQN